MTHAGQQRGKDKNGGQLSVGNEEEASHGDKSHQCVDGADRGSESEQLGDDLAVLSTGNCVHCGPTMAFRAVTSISLRHISHLRLLWFALAPALLLLRWWGVAAAVLVVVLIVSATLLRRAVAVRITVAVTSVTF